MDLATIPSSQTQPEAQQPPTGPRNTSASLPHLNTSTISSTDNHVDILQGNNNINIIGGDEEDDDTEPFLVVRALYPFLSEDQTSMSFQKNDLIQVLTQQESGWWYGYCRGNRGWFPSNYVEVITNDDFEGLSEDEGDEAASNDLWLPQTTADGQVFYFNTRTSESSWTLPDSSLALDEKDEEDGIYAIRPRERGESNLGDTARRNGTTTSTLSTSTSDGGAPSSDVASRDGTDMNNVNGNMRASREPTDTDSQAGSTRPSSWQTSAIPTRAGSPVSQGPPTALTDLRKPSVWETPSGDASSTALPPLPAVSNPFESEPTWESLADHTTGALQNLLHSAENGFKAYYQIQATQIVEAIRVMLYASGTVDKDSEPIRLHRGLKLYHRQIMAALSKLVLSAKMASSFWPADGAVTKMLADANDVAQAVHQFIFTAQSAGVTVHEVDAKLVLDPSGPFESQPAQQLSRAVSNASRISSTASVSAASVATTSVSTNYQGLSRAASSSSSIIHQLDYYTKSSTKALNVLSQHLKKAIEVSLNPVQPQPSSRLSLGSSILNSAQSSQLVNQCHQTISQLGSLLNMVGEFYTQTLRERLKIEDQVFINVRSSKQILYNNVASLVMVIQLTTDPMVQTSVLEMALEATATAENSTIELIGFTRTLAAERETSERATWISNKTDTSSATLMAPSMFAPQPRQSEIDIYFQDQDSDQERETSKNSRNRSNSQLSAFSIETSVTNISAPTTPGTEYTGRSQPNAFPFPHSGSSERPQSPPVSLAPAVPLVIHKPETRGEKLKKMLGDDAPAPKPKPVEQPWYMGHDYSPADISFNMEGHVRGGTLPALVERLTMHDGLDANFVATFMLTYRSFGTTEQLFALLFRRFAITPPLGLDPSELEYWQERKMMPIRLRVFNIIKTWLETYYLEDEKDDRQILPQIREFSESTLMRETMSIPAQQLTKLVEKREASDSSFRKMVLNLTTQAPQPITPRSLKRFKFMDLDPLELARQLTIMEAKYYNRIKPVECLAKAWTSEDPDIAAKAINIKKMIETSNLYSNWINEVVLGEKEAKKRANIIKHLVAVAERLRQLNNYSMLSATTAALSQSPIHRLKRTWELVPSKTMNALATLQTVTSSAKNWADYRTELHSANPPCVPFVGVYLTDLVMIQDGNPDFLRKTDNHINFYKRVSTAEVIREIQQYQSVPYCLTAVPEIQAFIRRGMESAKSVADLYDMSLAMEPRETDDERLTRVLAKSGFM